MHSDLITMTLKLHFLIYPFLLEILTQQLKNKNILLLFSSMTLPLSLLLLLSSRPRSTFTSLMYPSAQCTGTVCFPFLCREDHWGKDTHSPYICLSSSSPNILLHAHSVNSRRRRAGRDSPWASKAAGISLMGTEHTSTGTSRVTSTICDSI